MCVTGVEVAPNFTAGSMAAENGDQAKTKNPSAPSSRASWICCERFTAVAERVGLTPRPA